MGRDETCPISTWGGTRRVRLVRGEGRDAPGGEGREEGREERVGVTAHGDRRPERRHHGELRDAARPDQDRPATEISHRRCGASHWGGIVWRPAVWGAKAGGLGALGDSRAMSSQYGGGTRLVQLVRGEGRDVSSLCGREGGVARLDAKVHQKANAPILRLRDPQHQRISTRACRLA